VSTGSEVVTVILVQAQIKLCSVLNDGGVQAREEHMILLIQLGHWYYQQAVVLTSVAVNNC
jgi:hypothetical protein